jgi:putative protease
MQRLSTFHIGLHAVILVAWSACQPRDCDSSSAIALFVEGLALPASELVNRRKSPALWRDDLALQDVDDCLDFPVHPIRGRGLVQRPPEVMSPVGGFPQLRAAIANGADSVYLGLSAFSARARATNFCPLTELPDAVRIAHDADVKVYVALNTLVFDDELEEVEELIRNCAQAKVDALIVQDLGVVRLAQIVAPHLEVHASTQQTVTSADGAAFCDEVLGSSRVVLGRELSVAEIQSIAQDLDPNVELEAFVHGALCVSYSGQCFSSEAWGGRSANRGQCAQACRLPYGLVDNGELKELGDFSYILSPQDLCGIDQVPKLLEAHVGCLKIEGRLKDEGYVAATTRAYRNAVDAAWIDYCEKNDIDPKALPSGGHRLRALENFEEVTRTELAQVFSRGQDERHNGLSSGFFEGSRHQELVRGRSPRHRGVHVGRVEDGSSWKNGLIVRMDDDDSVADLKLGDGIVIDRGRPQEEELGGAIFEVSKIKDRTVTVRLSRDAERMWKKYDDNARKGFGSGAILAPIGAHVWKTNDAAVEKKMRRLSNAEPPKAQVKVSISGSLGQPLLVRIDNGRGVIGGATTDGVLVAAENSGLSEEAVRKAIGTLGNTGWALHGDIDTVDLDHGLWCPVSWIKEARRLAVQDLEKRSTSGTILSDDVDSGEVEKTLRYGVASALLSELKHHQQIETADGGIPSTAKLSVLARNFEQVDALCQMAEAGEKVDEIIVDFLEVDGMREAVARIRRTGIRTVVASPRIIKPNESGIWRTLLRLEPDALLVRSAGLLRRMTKLGGAGAKVDLIGGEHEVTVTIPDLIGDFSLNVANALTAWELLEYGCSRVTASYDLSANAVTELLGTLGPELSSQVEIVAHAHLPIFHTEHCVFARFLTNGNSYIDCGHACTRHNVHLRDQTGADNLVLADMGCRNTVFSAQAQSGAHSIREWARVGANHFRVELVDEPADDVQRITRGYMGILDGSTKPGELWDTLENVRDSNGRKAGVSHGSFRNGVERRAGEIV